MILFLAKKDHANVGWRFTQAIRAVGEEAKCYVQQPHQFRYPEHGTPFKTVGEIAERNTADWTVLLHSEWFPCPGRRAVFHGGTKYREHTERLDAFFNPRVEATFYHSLHGHHQNAVNPHWVIPPVDVDALTPVEAEERHIGHFPNKGNLKGTETIVDAAHEAEVPIWIEPNQVPWTHHLERLRACDVIIENQSYEYDWGMTALEAAALGKVVITNFLNEDGYVWNYGTHCPFLISNTPDELIKNLKLVANYTEKELRDHQRVTRTWVEQYHSLIPTGERLLKILED